MEQSEATHARRKSAGSSIGLVHNSPKDWDSAIDILRVPPSKMTSHDPARLDNPLYGKGWSIQTCKGSNSSFPVCPCNVDNLVTGKGMIMSSEEHICHVTYQKALLTTYQKRFNSSCHTFCRQRRHNWVMKGWFDSHFAGFLPKDRCQIAQRARSIKHHIHTTEEIQRGHHFDATTSLKNIWE